MASTTPSTRTLTRLSGRYLRTTGGSRSLERGLSLLRTFRVGTGVLTNAELAARSGLPRPTVSRLTRSLVDAGFLTYDHGQRGYRLGPVSLSLGLSYRSAQSALDAALPFMRELAEGRRINVGLAIRDQTEMIYLDSVRRSQLSVFRRIVPGVRIPIALTALGRACLASLPPVERDALLEELARDHRGDWHATREEIRVACEHFRLRGFCWARWQATFFSVAAPVVHPDGQHYSLNISLPAKEGADEDLIETYGELLCQLKASIDECWAPSAQAPAGTK